MDQRELETRVRQLNKTVAANEAPANALNLLNSLKKDAAPTEEMLRVCFIFDMIGYKEILRMVQLYLNRL